jgi:aminoglycoside phosphotransferase family enzyme/predicted kinase
VTGQEPLVRALADPAVYPHRPPDVTHVQTHISHVFLAGPYVYKLKKAVVFPFLDFGTAARRRQFCDEEVRLNRRLAPEVYLGVLPVTREAGGRLALGGAGPAVDHVVWMRRLPDDRSLARLAPAGAVDDATMDALATRLAAFHASVESSPAVAAHADPERLLAHWRENLEAAGDVPAEDREVLADFGEAWLREHAELLRDRQRAGRIRDGHGDLRADHVYFLDTALPALPDAPAVPAGVHVLDAIEFSAAYRANDVASEVAFLAMDLEARDCARLAARFVDAYVRAAGDPGVRALLPFYVSYRACVRGKVDALQSGEPEVAPEARAAAAARSRRHFALALRWAWRAAGPAVVACCGLSGTGKSTVAAALAATTGFTLVSTDALRPRAPADAGRRWASGRYSAAAREAVYVRLAAAADAALASGEGVVADATFMRAVDRRRLADVAARHGVPVCFVECRADEAVVRTRLDARDRTPSISDARWDTHLEQRRRWEPLGAAEPHVVVDAGGSRDAARAAAIRALWAWRRAAPEVAPRVQGRGGT